MARTRRDIEESKTRVKTAIRLLRDELIALESELRSIEEPAKLDENFFWKILVPVLSQYDRGITSRRLRLLLSGEEFEISVGNFRTFLSRYKARKLLTSRKDAAGRTLWRLSPDSDEAMIELNRTK